MEDLPARFAAALRRRTDPARPELLATALAAACCEVLPVDGATVSVVGPGPWRLPVGAGDDAAAAAERWRFTVGSGPATPRADGPAGHGAVLVTDEDALRRGWPALHDQLRRHTPYRSTITASLRLQRPDGPPQAGALDLYLRRPRALDPAAPPDRARVERVAALVGAGLPGAPAGRAPDWLDAPTARRRQRAWMAISMARQVLGLDEADATDLLRATAYGQDRTAEDVADDVVEGRTPVAALRG